MDGIILILGGLGLIHFFNWLVTKGIIWVAFSLFNANWYDNFWAVYVGGCIIYGIFGGCYKSRN